MDFIWINVVAFALLVGLRDEQDPPWMRIAGDLLIALNVVAIGIWLLATLVTPAKAATLSITESAVTDVLLVTLLVAPIVTLVVIGGFAVFLWYTGGFKWHGRIW